MADEARERLMQMLRDMVGKVLSDHTVLPEQKEIVAYVEALLVRRALEARNEALEAAAVIAETGDIRDLGEGATRIKIARKIRSLAAGGERT